MWYDRWLGFAECIPDAVESRVEAAAILAKLALEPRQPAQSETAGFAPFKPDESQLCLLNLMQEKH